MCFLTFFGSAICKMSEQLTILARSLFLIFSLLETPKNRGKTFPSQMLFHFPLRILLETFVVQLDIQRVTFGILAEPCVDFHINCRHYRIATLTNIRM